ncbi:MAG TPA: MOSC domain-containing protein [Spirochaetota bacterium]|nr:MOSC domain-containing protein [Spirochaetota bacterium]
MGKIKAICISPQKGRKDSVKEVNIIENWGIEGDWHSKKDSDRQVSFLSTEAIKEVVEKGIIIKDGDFGENFILTDIEIKNIKIGNIIKLGDSVQIEVKKIGKDCVEPCIIYKTVGMCVMPTCGVFGKVIKGGRVKVDDSCSYS